METVLLDLGLWPQSPLHLLAVLPPLLLWWTSRSWARRQHITRWHNAVLAVSFWEEVLFRGVVYGSIMAPTHSAIWAIALSSLLFGLFHLRNLWWADRRRIAYTCLYAGLFVGPIFALLRWWSGDIYLSILAHFLNNYTTMRRAKQQLVTDDYLEARLDRRNWFEKLFS